MTRFQLPNPGSIASLTRYSAIQQCLSKFTYTVKIHIEDVQLLHTLPYFLPCHICLSVNECYSWDLTMTLFWPLLHSLFQLSDFILIVGEPLLLHKVALHTLTSCNSVQTASMTGMCVSNMPAQAEDGVPCVRQIIISAYRYINFPLTAFISVQQPFCHYTSFLQCQATGDLTTHWDLHLAKNVPEQSYWTENLRKGKSLAQLPACNLNCIWDVLEHP